MKIAHVNLFDYQGGSARIAWMLKDGLQAQGHDVRIFAHRCSQKDDSVIPIPFLQHTWQKALLGKQQQQGLFDLYSAALLGVFRHPFFLEADIVHLHCINAGYFSFFLLPFLAVKPVIWTLHDPLAFTAGCLYPDACKRWEQGNCEHCPMPTAPQQVSRRTEAVQGIKQDIYKLIQLTTVCPSRWLQQHVQKSMLKDQEQRLIYNGIDTGIFAPKDKLAVRRKLGLPLHQPMLMFAAHGGFNSRMKGGHLLLQALRQLEQQYPELILINIGTSNNEVLQGLQLQRVDLPYIQEPAVLAEYYAAADVFVSPSMAENLSLVLCEALAAGTPAVAFRVGGNEEIIDHQRNGYLVKPFDCQELAAGIRWVLQQQDQAGLQEQARKKALHSFDLQRMIGEYAELYQTVIDGRNSK